MIPQTLIKPSIKLFEAQKETVRALTKRRRALLTDKAGSGKSLSTLYSFAYLKEKNKLKNMLVMTPLSAYSKLVWSSEVKKFTNMKAIDIEVLAKRVDNKYDRLEKLLTEFDVIYAKHSHVKQILPFITTLLNTQGMMFVIDEVHAFRNQRSALTLKLKYAMRNAMCVWGLTATPLSKNLEDTYNIINIIKPWFLGDFTSFRENYCNTEDKIIGRAKNGKLRKVLQITGIKNERKFQEKIKPLVIVGETFVDVKFHYMDYELSSEEMRIYRKVANGVGFKADMSSQDWITSIMGSDDELDPKQIKDIQKHSSRFLYLQSAADGVLSATGSQDQTSSTKIDMLLNLLDEIVARGESTLIYFDYYASLGAVKAAIKSRGIQAVLKESTGENVLGNTEVTEAKVKAKPYIILATKASSESVSYYFINNVINFHIPTVPHVFAQMTGRITRKNTLFPDNLNCWIFRSNNIDLYKLMVVSAKSYQMEIVAGPEGNIPSDYKQIVSKAGMMQKMKKVLLWMK